MRKVRERKRRKGERTNLDTRYSFISPTTGKFPSIQMKVLEFKPLQGSCQSFKFDNLLQEAEAVSDLIDAVVSILPWVNFDTFLPALKHTHIISLITKYCNAR